jgi:predicted DNA-binding transcriptional regulator YafY
MSQWMEHKPMLRLSDVRERWGISLRTFRRDLARLRDAGFIIDPAADSHQHDPAVTKAGWRAA